MNYFSLRIFGGGLGVTWRPGFLEIDCCRGVSVLYYTLNFIKLLFLFLKNIKEIKLNKII